MALGETTQQQRYAPVTLKGPYADKEHKPDPASANKKNQESEPAKLG